MPNPEPFLPGFHPDPSICRVGDTFYVVTSTFAYHPGLPIHRSRDLREWELIGHVLEGDAWPDMSDLDLSDGAWAPTIREHDGVFYVVFALARGRRGSVTYVCTTTDPGGSWSIAPIPDADGIDPSLFFDEDGRAWFTAARDATAPGATGPAEIWMREFDIDGLRLAGPTHILWHGALTGQWLEAPHIYRRATGYYLIGAEGGTERNHAVTGARASSITGPYRTDPRSPLLTHRHLRPDAPLQNVGHADLVTDADGAAWAVVLGVRPTDGHHTLGRESFLVPVEWTTDGPVFAHGSGVLTASHPAVVGPHADDWLSIRGPVDAVVDGAHVEIAPDPRGFADAGTPAFLGRRQDGHVFAFGVTVDPTAAPDVDTGIVAFQNPEHHVAVRLTGSASARMLEIAQRSAGVERVLAAEPVGGDGREPLRLVIEGDEAGYRFGRMREGRFIELAQVPASALSTETAGGFVGVVLGLFARGAEGRAPVHFDDVEYRRTAARVAPVI
ncbi:glycoside hydrolase family 43 protein [Microbacterium soli]|uniref:Glycoside hydrolase family 43 protein n=1 Tax=Microbacterium soli TaxID=446075 RepID=A0ABP7N000_9MICO